MTIFIYLFLPLGTNDYIMLINVYTIRVEGKTTNAVLLFEQGEML